MADDNILFSMRKMVKINKYANELTEKFMADTSEKSEDDIYMWFSNAISIGYSLGLIVEGQALLSKTSEAACG